MLSGAQVQGTTSTSVASALISQSYEACKWQCLYIIPHTDRHTHTHTYTHTDSHSHTVRITHHIWACHRKMEHSTDTHTDTHTQSQDNIPWWVNSSCSILSAAVITTDMCSGTWPSSESTSRICNTAQHL